MKKRAAALALLLACSSLAIGDEYQNKETLGHFAAGHLVSAGVHLIDHKKMSFWNQLPLEISSALAASFIYEAAQKDRPLKLENVAIGALGGAAFTLTWHFK